jgi:hypothetical protein
MERRPEILGSLARWRSSKKHFSMSISGESLISTTKMKPKADPGTKFSRRKE